MFPATLLKTRKRKIIPIQFYLPWKQSLNIVLLLYSYLSLYNKFYITIHCQSIFNYTTKLSIRFLLRNVNKILLCHSPLRRRDSTIALARNNGTKSQLNLYVTNNILHTLYKCGSQQNESVFKGTFFKAKLPRSCCNLYLLSNIAN